MKSLAGKVNCCLVGWLKWMTAQMMVEGYLAKQTVDHLTAMGRRRRTQRKRLRDIRLYVVAGQV